MRSPSVLGQKPRAVVPFPIHNQAGMTRQPPRFTYTIVIQPARIRSKRHPWPATDTEAPTKISGISDGFWSLIPSSLLWVSFTPRHSPTSSSYIET